MNGAGGTHSHIRTVSMKLSYKGTKRMAFKLAISSSERPFCLIAILISVFSATLRAQTPGEIDAHSFSSSLPTFSFCDQRAADCSSNSTAVPPQPGPGQSDPSSSNSHKNDWVHSWLREVDEARASQPHFVSPIVTTHVMLVQQFRYDMSWQQDPAGGTVTSNYGASHGLEIIPTTRLEVGIFPPSYLVHQSNVPDGFGDFSWQVKFRAFSATEGKGDYFVGFFWVDRSPRELHRMDWAILSCPPLSRSRKGSGPGTFRAQLARISQPVERISWAARLSSIPPLITGSREKSGLCSSKIQSFGRVGRWTERRKFF